MKNVLTVNALACVFALLSVPANAAGASSDYGKAVCQHLKSKAMLVQTPARKKALMTEYKRCLKEHGEG